MLPSSKALVCTHLVNVYSRPVLILSTRLHAYCSTNDTYNRVAVRNLWIPKWLRWFEKVWRCTGWIFSLWHRYT